MSGTNVIPRSVSEHCETKSASVSSFISLSEEYLGNGFWISLYIVLPMHEKS